MNVKELISLIKEEVPNKAIDLMDSLELLKETIADTLTWLRACQAPKIVEV